MSVYLGKDKVLPTIRKLTVAPPLKMGVMRSDAELVEKYSYDKWLIGNEILESLPAYSTSANTLVASKDLTPTITLDYSNYKYFILERFLTIPTYSISSKAKGRVEYSIASHAYEICEIPANNFITLIDSSKQVTSRSVTLTTSSFLRLLYWTSGTAIAAYSTAAYGTVQAVTSPTINSGVLTLKSPAFNIRGHTSYFTSTYFNALTDIRYQYIIEVYRVSNNNRNINGWANDSQSMHILSCINNDETHTLT